MVTTTITMTEDVWTAFQALGSSAVTVEYGSLSGGDSSENKEGRRWTNVRDQNFCLISDFLPTPRTILEISVNLKRRIFEGEGVGVYEGYWCTVTQHGTGMYHLRPQNPKRFLGEDPRPPLKRMFHLGFI